MKNTHHQTASFNAHTFNPMNGLNKTEIVHYQQYVERGLVGKSHSVFISNEQMTLSISMMKKLDPLLAVLCHLSHKYTLHPIYQIGLACLGNKPNCIQLGNDVDCIRTELELTKSEWQLIQPYIGSIYTHQPIFLFQNTHCINPAEELNSRWSNVYSRLINFGVIDSTVSLFSYFSTALCKEEFKQGVLLNIIPNDDYNHELYVKLLYESFGSTVPDLEIIYYPPKDPFDYVY